MNRRLFVATMMTVALVASLVDTPGVAAAASGFGPRATRHERSVPGGTVKPDATRATSQTDQRPWSGPSTVDWNRPGALRLAPAVAPAAAGRSTVDKATFTMADRATTAKAGVTGVLFSVRSPSAGTATVQVDYSGFRGAYGGDWASRLRLVALPACALTTPDRAGCRAATPVVTANDPAAATLTAAVPVDTAGSVFAATAAPTGASGSYSATSLAPSGHWTVGGNSGSFGWSYDVEVPGVPGGLEPDINLTYSSSSVDGRTAVTNNQPSWIGEGWDYDPGYIERQYATCKDDGGTTGDLCWKTDNATMQLDGKSTTLVKDDATGTWRLADDDGSRVEHLTGTATDTANGDNDNEYWRITTVDGTQYWFGKNRLPGWSTGKAETASTYTAPVFGNGSGEPCHASTFAASACDQAYRWQLDYVVDPHGDAMALFYTKESNAYAKNAASTATASYTRGGYLSRIEYGHRAGQVYAASAPAIVWFDVSERCLSSCATFDAAHAANWPDTPADEQCAAGASCLVTSPTFWSRKRLTGIRTQVLVGTAYSDVDAWALTQQFPGTGDNTSPSLWLASITRTGKAGTAVAMPPVDFGGTAMDNRVDSDEGRPPLHKYRITRVSNETGADTLVTYSPPECAYNALPTQETSTKRCFPMWWTPDGYSAPLQDWFHRYVVTQVVDDDKVAGSGSESKVTTYEYLGGVAWHRDDSEFTLDKHRGWNQFRGYATVRVREGGSAASMTDTTYFRGMDGDVLPDGSTRKVTVADTEGDAVTDGDALAGTVYESVTYTADGGTVDEASVTVPWVSAATATHARTGLPPLVARYTDDGTVNTRELVSTSTGTAWRRTTQKHTYNADGLEVTDEDDGDTAVTGDETCERSTYTARDTTNWQLSYVDDVVTSAGTCDVAASPGNTRDEERTYYDGQALGVAPKAGQAHETRSENLDHFSGTTPVYAATTSTYDAYDREVSGTDELGNTTTTAYTPSSGAVPTSRAETDPKGRTTTETLNTRGQTLSTVDANGRATYTDYDALGRLTAVWLPGRAKSQPANETYAYAVPRTAPTVITTKTLQDDGSYQTSLTIYDGLMRERQTQASAHGGGRVIEDTFYDSHGRAWKTNEQYWNSAAPTGTLFNAADSDVPAQTVNTYDGEDRVTVSALVSYGVEQWRTTTSYGGNWTATVPPAGATPTLTVNDVDDHTVELRQFKSGTPSFSAAAGTYDDTRYAYDVDGHLTKVVDPAGNIWSYGFDLRDHQISASDPDSGTIATTYDLAGDVTSTTDARGTVLAYTYDELGRRTSERLGSATGTKLAEWTYDTVSGGLGLAATSVRYAPDGSAYTLAVTGYDAGGRTTGTALTVPSVPGEERLAGTYPVTDTYTVTGKLASTTYPAVAGLPAETVNRTYSPDGLLSTVDNGTATYLGGAQYTAYGELSQSVLGATGNRVVRTLTYENATRRLSTVTDDRERTGPQTVDKRTYAYDPAGNVTRIRDDRDDASTVDDQCFRYDYLRRLTDAWTATDACAAAPGTATVGGAAPYWQTFTYDVAGNRRTEVRHGATAAGDVTRTYAYPAAGGAQPHTLSSVVTTGASSRTDTYGYDAAGDTTNRSGQTLEWDAEGKLAKATVGGASTSFLYDADGGRLLRRDPTSTTLYLDDQEITLNRAAGSLSGVRFYDVPGATVERSSTGTVSYLLADANGTNEVSVDAGTLGYTRRDTAPFGGIRGTAPASWPDDKGFVGGTADPTTGLTQLGARMYDPDTGRFISVDPVLDPTDPQQVNGYAYADNNPVSMTDPDGTWAILPGGHYCDGCGGYNHAPKPKKKKHYSVPSGHPTQRFRKGTAKYRANQAEMRREAAALRRAAARHHAQRVARHHQKKKSGGCHGFWGCLGHIAKRTGHYIKKGAKTAWAHRTSILSACSLLPVVGEVCGAAAMVSAAYDAYVDYKKGHYTSMAFDIVGGVAGGASFGAGRLSRGLFRTAKRYDTLIKYSVRGRRDLATLRAWSNTSRSLGWAAHGVKVRADALTVPLTLAYEYNQVAGEHGWVSGGWG